MYCPAIVSSVMVVFPHHCDDDLKDSTLRFVNLILHLVTAMRSSFTSALWQCEQKKNGLVATVFAVSNLTCDFRDC